MLEWVALVNSMPADYFARPSHGALVKLCRHLVIAQRLARLIEACAVDETLDAKPTEFFSRSSGPSR
jgi:hypothetical protein